MCGNWQTLLVTSLLFSKTSTKSFPSLCRWTCVLPFLPLTSLPSLSLRQTYIAGESYAGMYIPYSADAILKSTHVNTPLKGLLIGNGWISPREQYPAYLTYLVDNGLIKKNSQEYRNVEAAVKGCQKKIAEMDAKGSKSKGLVLVAECEAILGAMSGATMKECVLFPLSSLLCTDSSLVLSGLCLNSYDTREYHACGSEWPADLVQVTQYLRVRFCFAVLFPLCPPVLLLPTIFLTSQHLSSRLYSDQTLLALSMLKKGTRTGSSGLNALLPWAPRFASPPLLFSESR
jgi:carboxypeptidase C (cathepsin A)